MKVLVTGASGFLGLALSRSLARDGHEVHGLFRHRSRAFEELPRSSAFLGEISRYEDVRRAAVGATAIMHVAAKAGVWGKASEYEAANVRGTENVVRAARELGISKLVYTSTPSVVHGGTNVLGVDESAPYATSYRTHYPRTKAIAERMVLRANSASLSTCALRPHLIWGPGDTNLIPRILDRARQGRLVLVDGGKAIIDATFIDNAVHAHRLALERLAPEATCAGRAYFIAQGEPMPMKQLIDGILQAHGLSPSSRTIPLGAARVVGALLEAVYGAFGIDREPPLTRFVAEQLGTSHHYDLSAAKRDLGYEAIVTTQAGLQLIQSSAKSTARAE